jgi:hypothetical protein
MKNLELNLIQSIAFTGVIVSLASQLGLFIISKHVERFWAVYPVWVAVFVIGSLLRKYGNNSHADDHEHHHAH